MRLVMISVLSVVVFGAALPVAMAQHAGDVGLVVVENQITTNLIDSGSFTPERVFGSEFGELFPNFTDEPGFDSLPGAFEAGSLIGFRMLGALRAWDGASFSAIAPVQISIGFGPVDPVVTPLDDVVSPGFSLAVGSNGQWHRHLEFTLLSPATDGIYLLGMQLFSSEGGVADSEPFWFVFNQNSSEDDHDAAIDWTRRHVVPAPGSIALLMSSGLFWGQRRRRRP